MTNFGDVISSLVPYILSNCSKFHVFILIHSTNREIAHLNQALGNSSISLKLKGESSMQLN